MATPKAYDWTHGHVQRETGTDSVHVERELALHSTHGRVLRVKFQVPAHIYRNVNSAERERIRFDCEELFRKMLFVATIAQVPGAEQICLEETLRTYIDRIYRAFVNVQWAAGNKKWLVPATIQKNVLEEN